MTDNQLNISWTVAAAKALRKFSRSAAWVMETMVLVTEVPMLDPKIIGMAFFTGAPADTKATKRKSSFYCFMMEKILFWFLCNRKNMIFCNRKNSIFAINALFLLNPIIT